MARNARIFRAKLTLSLIDRDVYAEPSVSIALHPSETIARMTVRLLAFALCWEPGLAFGRGVSTTEEPDLWRHRPDGRIAHWIEVGRPDPRRLVQATRVADRVTTFAFGTGVERWWNDHAAALERVPRLGLLRLDDGFVAALAAGVERRIDWTVTRSEGTVYVSTADVDLETLPEVWLGQPLA